MNFLTNLDLSQNQLLNVVLQPLAVAPNNPRTGQIYYNTTDKVIYVYDGAVWKKSGTDGLEAEIDLTDYYTKEQIEELFATKEDVNEILSQSSSISIQVVDSLPASGASNVIYLVSNGLNTDKNIYDEYLWTGASFEKIGDTSIDLTNYVTKDDLSSISHADVSIMTLSAGFTLKTSQSITGRFLSLTALDEVNNDVLIIGYRVNQASDSFTVTVNIEKSYYNNIKILITYLR